MLAHEVQLQAGHHVEGLATLCVPRRVCEQHRSTPIKQLMMVGKLAHTHLSPAQILDLGCPGVADRGRVRHGLALGGRRRLAQLGPHALNLLGSVEHDERVDSLAWIDIAGVSRGWIVLDVRYLVEKRDGLFVDASFHCPGQVVGKILRFLTEELLDRARHILGMLEPIVGQGQSSPDHGREDQGQD